MELLMDEGIVTLPAAERSQASPDAFPIWAHTTVSAAKAPRPLGPSSICPSIVPAGQGRIVAIRGSVLELAFPRNLPSLHEALKVTDTGGRTLILEVEQIRGPETVRAIALGNTEGLARGLAVART